MTNYFNANKINELVKLKFSISNSLESYNEILTSINEFNLHLFSEDLDIIKLISEYKENIITTGKILSSEQNLIYSEIDKTLLDNCCHEWEDDIIEGPLDSEINICYCKKCLYYKKK